MSNTKFDEAAFSSNDVEPFNLISLEKLNDLRTNFNTIYMATYEGHLYCPECHKPQLTLVHNPETNEYFLRGFPKQKHTEDCSKSFESVSKTLFDDFVEDPDSYDFINTKLHKLIDKLIKKTILIKKASLIKVVNDKCIKDEITDEDITTRINVRNIPTKSITAPFDDDDFDRYKLFYGDVDISLTKKENKQLKKDFYVLRIYRRNTNFTLCSLSMSESVAIHLNEDYDIVSNKTEIRFHVYISFATVLHKTGIYKNGNLKRSNLCVIRKV